jgi:arylsulfatase A-like enzyme
MKKVLSSLLLGTSLLTQAQEKPNIVYILADDLGYGDLSCYGQQNFKTPNIDKLAKQGVKFINHYSGSTVSAPSRYSLLTGKHMGHAYIRGNGEVRIRQNPEDKTIATILQENGYVTGMVGKASTGCKNDPKTPNQKGFDYFFGYLGHAQAHSYFPKYLHCNGEKIEFPTNGVENKWRGEVYSPDLFIDSALTFLDKNSQNQFFLHYSSPLPHAQMWVPEKWKTKYKGKFSERKYRGYYGACDDANATTAGMIERLDWEVGQIVEKLEKLGLMKNTIIMFSSDNGAHVEGGRIAKYHNSSGGLRGVKRDLYEGGIRVPLIVRWDGNVKPNTSSGHISAFWDFAPTVCDIIGAECEEYHYDGISMLPTLLGKTNNQKQHKYLYWEFNKLGGRQALRVGKWKAVRYGITKNKNAKIELFNLDLDKQEVVNVAKENPDVVKQMMNLFQQVRTESVEFPLFSK